MQIDQNPKELEAMQEFHRGNRKEGLRLQEEFAAEFRREYQEKDHCPCQKHVATMEIAKNAWPFTEPIRSMCPTVCGPC